MKKWEHLHFKFYDTKEDSINDEQYKYEPKETYIMVWNEIGSQGWEMVSADGNTNSYI